jgi:hypothetical protein
MDAPSVELDSSITTGRPAHGLIASFYAELGQAAEMKTIQDAFPDNPWDAETAVPCVLHVEEGNRLVGLLRAVKNPKDGTGVVYEVAVERHHRGSRLSSRLLNELEKRHPGIKWQGYPARMMPDLDRTLTSIRTLFGIALILAFQDATRGLLEMILSRNQLGADACLRLLLLLVALLLVGWRMFWTVGVVRRFVLGRVLALKRGGPAGPGGAPTSKIASPRRAFILWFCYPVLFVHATLFFFLSSLFRGMVQTPVVWNVHLIGLLGALLLLNAVWLYLLRPIGSHLKMAVGPGVPSETLWIRNNLVFGSLTLLVYLASSQLGPATAITFASILWIINSAIDFAMTREIYTWADAY